MGIVRGGAISRVVRGGVEYTQIRRGGVPVWEAPTAEPPPGEPTLVILRDTFNRADSDDVGSNWTHNDFDTYKAGIFSKSTRLAIPDGSVFGLDLRIDRLRYNAGTLPNDDCYLKFGVASQGSSGSSKSSAYRTQVYYRLSNTGFSHGVGVQLDSSTLRIVRRVSGTTTTMVNNCGAFTAGDQISMDATGNVHTLFRNGTDVGVWNDNGATASKGSGFRSMGYRVDGAKEFLGSRRFSPRLDFVEVGAYAA